MKKIILFSILVALSTTGCFPKEKVIIKTQIVKVLVPVKPEGIPAFSNIKYPVEYLNKTSSNQQIVRAYFDSLAMCFAEVEKRDSVLQVIRDFETEKKEFQIETIEAH